MSASMETAKIYVAAVPVEMMMLQNMKQ